MSNEGIIKFNINSVFQLLRCKPLTLEYKNVLQVIKPLKWDNIH